MSVVMVEGGYRNVSSVYLRPTTTDQTLVDAGLPEGNWTLFDEEGRKCICAVERSKFFFWVSEHDIELITVH